ncbi:unnamed protein product [Didymodactylos carnosus]|uniref:CW-type domain-containing protein n=1 Tax=Didymodactylos carnosus TaxID=1234261 RepID=A0A813P4Q6_9BILA|nr:unnamed protein product [Didymodactylos carnosus]CAF0747569.1 unnamed protein product [Didymodactylos carnosus]CAF3502370.1 unnamed protein product [Didymodactylos carnosus]CAF3526632.1 unnamed protein product [Didymodactylos carnosus]
MTTPSLLSGGKRSKTHTATPMPNVGEPITEEELRKKDTPITVDDVLRLRKPTKEYLCETDENSYKIDFVRFRIRDMVSNHVLFEVERSTEDGDIAEDDSSSSRFVQYHFPPTFLKLKQVGAQYIKCFIQLYIVDFTVGDKEVKSFQMIERHYFRDQLIKSFDFNFGFCMPNSRNSIEHIYDLPEFKSDQIKEMVKHPYETKSDSFYFVDNCLIMHKKAEYAFNMSAELVDNARDAKAQNLKIFTVKDPYLRGGFYLAFLDDGCGMHYEEVFNVIVFGKSNKRNIETNQIGQYGNGLKSGAMRISNDFILFTKKDNVGTCLFLSRTFHTEEDLNQVIVPMPSFNLTTKEPLFPSNNEYDQTRYDTEMKLIYKYSPFKTRDELFKQFEQIKSSSGTLIILYNMKLLDNSEPELDIKTDKSDILIDSRDSRSISDDHYNIPAERRSLRAYVSILYYEPRMKVYIQNKKVITKKLSCSLYKPRMYKCMSNRFKKRSEEEAKKAQEDCLTIEDRAREAESKALDLAQRIGNSSDLTDRSTLRKAQMAASQLKSTLDIKKRILERKQREIKDPKVLNYIFGLNVQERSADGVFVYNCGRLIKMYERVGILNSKALFCRGVVGVVDVPYIVLEPTHNKQSFADEKEYAYLLKIMGDYMKQYWDDTGIENHVLEFWESFGYAKEGGLDTSPSNESIYSQRRLSAVGVLLQCDKCLKWRRLPFGSAPTTQPDTWTCSQNPNVEQNSCDIPEKQDILSEGTLKKPTISSPPSLPSSDASKSKRILPTNGDLVSSSTSPSDKEKASTSPSDKEKASASVLLKPSLPPQQLSTMSRRSITSAAQSIVNNKNNNNDKSTKSTSKITHSSSNTRQSLIQKQQQQSKRSSMKRPLRKSVTPRASSGNVTPTKKRRTTAKLSDSRKNDQSSEEEDDEEKTEESDDEDEQPKENIRSTKCVTANGDTTLRSSNQPASREVNSSLSTTNDVTSSTENTNDDSDTIQCSQRLPPRVNDRIRAMYQSQKYPGIVLTVNNNSKKFKMRFDAYPTAEFDRWYTFASPEWSYEHEYQSSMTAADTPTYDNQLLTNGISLSDTNPDQTSLQNNSMSTVLTDETTTTKAMNNFKSLIKFMLPPDWILKRDEITALDLKGLADFPCEQFMQSYREKMTRIVEQRKTDEAKWRSVLDTVKAQVTNIMNLDGMLIDNNCTIEDFQSMLSEYIVRRQQQK